MQQLGIESLQGLLEEGVTGCPGEVESLKQEGVEIDEGDELAIARPSVELESQEDKQGGERKLDRPAKGGLLLWDHITKIDKFIKQEVKMARLGCVV